MPDYTHSKGKFTLPDDLKDLSAVIVEDLDIEEYHDLGKFSKHGENAIVSKSQLVEMDCPAKFKHKYLDEAPAEDKDHFNVGNAVHTLALEPTLFHDRFYIIPEGTRRDKRTDAYKACMAEAGFRKMVTSADYLNVKGMAEALRGSRVAMKLLERAGRVEPSIFFTDEVTGMRLRARPDFMGDDGLIVDLKTARTAEPDAFYRHAFDLHYDMSVALTSEAYKRLTGKMPDNYVFLVIESGEPHVIEAFDSFRPVSKNDPSNLNYYGVGEWRLRASIDKLAECRKRGFWPGYTDGKIKPMGVPAYELKKMEE